MRDCGAHADAISTIPEAILRNPAGAVNRFASSLSREWGGILTLQNAYLKAACGDRNLDPRSRSPKIKPSRREFIFQHFCRANCSASMAPWLVHALCGRTSLRVDTVKAYLF